MQARNRPYRSPRRDQQALETRRTIAQAALALFTEQGFSETSIREVAERASVSEQTIYKAFGDKVGLLSEAAAQYIETGGGGAEAAFLEALEAETAQDPAHAGQAGFLSTHPSNPERILQLMDAMPKALEEKNKSGMISAPVLVK